VEAARRRLTFRLRDDCDLDDPEPEEVRGAMSDTVFEAMLEASWLDVWSVFGWRR
jgi:hypothetical protein